MNRKERRAAKKKSDHGAAGAVAQRLFDQGLEKHLAGATEEAVHLYEKALSADPAHVDARHCLGVAYLQMGDPVSAETHIEMAISQNSNVSDFHFNLGLAQTELAKSSHAISAFREALALQPDHHGAGNSLGLAFANEGDHESAVDVLQNALQKNPHALDIRSNLAKSLFSLDRLDEALAELEAITAQAPDLLEALYNKGCVLSALQRFPQAKAAFDRCLEIQSDYIDALSNRGHTHMMMGDSLSAEADIRRVLELDSEYGPAWQNLSTEMVLQGRLPEALAHSRTAVRVSPEDPAIHWNMAMDCLRNGLLEEAWQEYQWGFAANMRGPYHDLPYPRWQGEDLSGKHLLVWCEQGLADEIQQARFFDAVLKQGAQMTVVCERRLVSLFQRTFPEITVESADAFRWGEGAFDFHCPGYDVMAHFATDLSQIPRRKGYVVPDPERTSYWRAYLMETAPEAKIFVGLHWQSGNVKPPRDRLFLYCKLNDFSPLLTMDQVCFVNLNYIDVASEIAVAKSKFGVEVLTPKEIDLKEDVDDVSSLMAALDVVIGGDSFGSWHGAAVGVETWTLSHPSLWLWLGEHERSIWSDNVRLFLQDPLVPIESNMRKVANALKSRIDDCVHSRASDG